MQKNEKCLIITGPTASGKTHLAVTLARLFDGEIISADSRQVFRGLDIGTGKDLNEYSKGGNPVPYHLIDIVNPNDDFNLFLYLKEAKRALADVQSREKLPIVCGGTPLYIKALLDGYDQEGGKPDFELRKQLEAKGVNELLDILKDKASPRLYQRTDKTQKRRIIRALELAYSGSTIEPVPIIGESLILAPYFQRKELHKRIENRLDARLADGLLKEVAALHEQGLSWERMDWLGLEYRFAAMHLSGKLTLQEMHDMLLAHIRQFCKRQDGWFRKLERDGATIHWLREGDVNEASTLVKLWLQNETLPPPAMQLNDIRYTSKL